MDNVRNVKIDKLMLKDTCTANVRKEYLDSLRKEKIDKVHAEEHCQC
jgi:hypothetical protein